MSEYFQATGFSIPRGPPKKPKKSGFALWVGNLPPSTTLLELCALFGTNDIQSIFLIQRTFCAFVNYKTEKALYQGKDLFERRGKVLRGNQLVVKIKAQLSEENSDYLANDYPQTTKTEPQDSSQSTEAKDVAPNSKYPTSTSKDRYFVCKSLTVEDLQASASYGVWATQSHNQTVFNEAFNNCDNVYLIFSANRAGEYYGYARMSSKIPKTINKNLLPLANWNWSAQDQEKSNPEASSTSAEVEPPALPVDPLVNQLSALKYPNCQSPNIPRVYPTQANPSIPIPAGRIVDDSSRGTLFWEAVEEDPTKSRKSSTDSGADSKHTSISSPALASDAAGPSSGFQETTAPSTPPQVDTEIQAPSSSEDENSSSNNWTIPFKIEWLSPPGKTVPFFMVKHLRNPYNKNQPVKIARDGTEIEPSIGRKVVDLFHH